MLEIILQRYVSQVRDNIVDCVGCLEYRQSMILGRMDIMKEKSAWDRFFDDTEDIQCISCLDAYVLKYAIDGCWVQINRHSRDKDSKFTLSIRGYDEENKKDLYESDFSKEWKEKNVYNQALYKKFVSGYFFH